MTNLIIFKIVIILVDFFVKLAVLYLLIKIFNKSIKFPTTIRAIFIYEAISFLFIWIFGFDRFKWATGMNNNYFAFLIYLIIVVTVLFLIFGIIMKKFSLLNFGKSLIVFLIMACLIIPILFYSQYFLMPTSARKTETQYQAYYGVAPSLSSSIGTLKIIDKIGDALLRREIVKELRIFMVTAKF